MFRVRWLVIIVAVLIVGGADFNSCDISSGGIPPEGLSTTITSQTNNPPNCGPDYDSPCLLNNSGGGPYPAIEVGSANSCQDEVSDVAGRIRYCRVVDGYDTGATDGPAALRDKRDWTIDIAYGYPESLTDSTNNRYGYSVVLYSGEMFEGCEVDSIYGYGAQGTYDSVFNCAYRIRKPVITKASNNAWDYVLRKAWDWSGYVGNAADCAGGLAGVMAGVGHITFPLLRGCADGPM